jgi:DNA-binding MarR family transcriptional regulator
MPSTELQFAFPDDIESPPAKMVYLYLASYGEATVSELRDGLDLSTLSVLTLLETLESNGLVRREETGYRLASSTA